MIGVFALEFVSGAAVEVEFEFALRGFGDDDGAFGKGDARAAFGASFKEEDTVPVGAAGGDVVDVEDHVGKTLVEDAWLHLKRNLRGDETGFDVAKSAEAPRGEDDGHEQGEHSTGNGEKANGKEDAFAADAK